MNQIWDDLNHVEGDELQFLNYSKFTSEIQNVEKFEY